VAAVGTQYLHEMFDRRIERAFYELARYDFEILVEAAPLEALKVCILMAMYNISNKATIALVYVGKRLSDPLILISTNND
jgi:hypothetical protein